jgi:hypothetical protein
LIESISVVSQTKGIHVGPPYNRVPSLYLVLSMPDDPLPTLLESGIYLLARHFIATATTAYMARPLKKRFRILPAGGLGVSPSFKKSPKIGGYRGLI